jgi:hypothetical protein
MFAAQFEQKLNNRNSSNRSGPTENTGATAERRGLLDDEEEIEFEVRKNQ